MRDLHRTVERVVALSKADACIAVATASSSANVRWANNTATTNGVATTSHLFVVSVRDNRVGTVGVSYFPDERLEPLVRESEAACEGKPEAEDAMELLGGNETSPDWADPPPEDGAEGIAGLAPGLAEALDRGEAARARVFGYAEHSTATTYLAASTGLRRRHTQREGLVEMTAKSADLSKSVWAGKAATSFAGLGVAELYGGLERRLGWCDTRLDLPPGRYEVLLTPSAVADMLVFLYWAASARDADEGRSVFSKGGGGNRIGERIAPPGVTLRSDPHAPGLETSPFTVAVASSRDTSVFDNGLPLSATEWVDDGVLATLVTTRHWAARTGRPVTPFIDNLVLAAGAGPTLDEMIASTRRALLLTCFWYIREVDPQTLLLTGLTRDGVFLVEDGEVRAAVNNFRFNMSPLDMLGRSVEIGRSEPTLGREVGDYFRLTKMPPLRVEGFNMSSVSEST